MESPIITNLHNSLQRVNTRTLPVSRCTHIIVLLLLLSLSVLHQCSDCFIGSCGNGRHRGHASPALPCRFGIYHTSTNFGLSPEHDQPAAGGVDVLAKARRAVLVTAAAAVVTAAARA